jgi:MFS family permease
MSEKAKVSNKTILAIIMLSFSGELAWAVENQYFNLFIYKFIAPIPIYVSIMVAVTAAVSTFTTIFMGTLSDVKGKRKSFLLFGYVFWALTTAIFPIAGLFEPVILGVTLAIVFDSVMSFFGATANDAALNAYVTDVTTVENRGTIGSIKEVMFLLAILVVYGFAGAMIDTVGFFNFFYIIAFIVGIIGIPGAFITPKPHNLQPSSSGYWKSIKSTYDRKALTKNWNFFKILISVGFWAIAFNVFFPFVLIYLEYYLNLDITVASILIFIALLVSIILAFPMGKIVDRIGRKKVAIVAVILEAASLLFFALVRNIILIAISSTLWVFAMLAYNIASRTWLKDLYPDEKRGQFHGFYLVFNVLIGMTVGPLIGGFIADLFGTPIIIDGVPGNIPPPLLFIVASIMMVMALIPLIKSNEAG